MKRSIVIILWIMVCFVIVSCSNTHMRYYKVQTKETWLIDPVNTIEVVELHQGYKIGDTINNQHGGIHLEIIVDTVR